MKKLLYFAAMLCGLLSFAQASVDPQDLLPPEQAFVPTVKVDAEGIGVQFKIADGYYMYQSKIVAATKPADLLGEPAFGKGEEKEDEFFGKQTVFHHSATAAWKYRQAAPGKYALILTYQGCAEVGVCYPPVETRLDIDGAGIYGTAESAAQGANAKDIFVKKPNGAASDSEVAPKLPENNGQGDSRFKLSRSTLAVNLLAFFIAGLGLSFTACMYPLLPIVSGIIVGDKNSSKSRAFWLSLVYVQGLALTYTLVGVLAGMTGALLTVWLQQAWVVFAASGLMVLLALSMFGLFNIQLPASVQGYFQTRSNRLSGGKMLSVFVMGMLSALIVGPCVAPPLAFAIGYIGQTGDGLLGGLALYALALGTGVPLILIATFGGHILPRAGAWMNGIKYAFGFLLLAAAVYLAAQHLPFWLAAAFYTLILLAAGIMLLRANRSNSGSLRLPLLLAGAVLTLGGAWFGIQSIRGQETLLHGFLTLHAPTQHATHRKFTDPAKLKAAIAEAFAKHPDQAVVLDFYADWCVSCKEMEAKTFNQPQVQAALPPERLFQIDVTENNAAQKAFLQEYGLYGPPGLFVLHADGSRSEALLGFAPPEEFLAWLKKNAVY